MPSEGALRTALAASGPGCDRGFKQFKRFYPRLYGIIPSIALIFC